MRRRFSLAVTAFLAMPGIVAYLIPWLVRPAGAPLHRAGAPVLALGTLLLLWCVRDFYVAGRGSLAPWAPPERLVITFVDVPFVPPASRHACAMAVVHCHGDATRIDTIECHIVAPLRGVDRYSRGLAAVVLVSLSVAACHAP